MKKIFSLILLLFVIITNAQNIEFTKENFKDNKDGLKEAKKNLEEGDKLFSQGSIFYRQALDFYLNANKFNPNNALLNYKIGKCYLYSSFKLKSLPFLEKALQPTS